MGASVADAEAKMAQERIWRSVLSEATGIAETFDEVKAEIDNKKAELAANLASAELKMAAEKKKAANSAAWEIVAKSAAEKKMAILAAEIAALEQKFAGDAEAAAEKIEVLAADFTSAAERIFAIADACQEALQTALAKIEAASGMMAALAKEMQALKEAGKQQAGEQVAIARETARQQSAALARRMRSVRMMSWMARYTTASFNIMTSHEGIDGARPTRTGHAGVRLRGGSTVEAVEGVTKTMPEEKQGAADTEVGKLC